MSRDIVFCPLLMSRDIVPCPQSWCRVTVWHGGQRVRLVKLAAESGHSEGVVSLLRSFEDTNELAVAVLAGSSARIHKLLSKGEVEGVRWLGPSAVSPLMGPSSLPV